MVIFTALFVAVITLLFGHLIFHQRIKHFMREDVVGEVLRRLSGKRDTDGGIRANDAEAGEPLDQQSTPSVSSPKGINGSEFEVFLSFRGEDTRKGFTGHLYEGLKLRCVSTFKDDENLEKGREIDKLLEYIEKSKIFVPIFSQRYAESIWCLKEITKSVECGKEIVPVFFGVKPSVVRSQSGVFRSAFEKHASNKKLNQEEVRKWREALKKVAHISGFDLDDMNGDEVKLKCAIIERVLSKVNKKPFEVTKHPIGIETRVQDVKKMLEGEGINGVHVVGIHGMGGLGKTTIARAVYNDLAQAFNGTRSFLSNITEKSGQPNGLVNLQKQLIRDICKIKDTCLSDPAQGKILIKERINCIKVLLILDDVSSIEQLDALAGGRDWFGSGSVIIITTRDAKMLLACNVKQWEIYKPEVLNEDQSRELFLRHAFSCELPKKEYLLLSNEVVTAAGGLPLTIEVLGSLLTCDMDLDEWKYTLGKLKNIPDDRVQQRLKLSYDRLQKFEQNIFLDISCFFIGWGREYATYMWEDCRWFPNDAIKVLVQRSLIEIDEKSQEFHMHDQIRDMGRAIVVEGCFGKLQKYSRLSNYQDVLDLLRRKVLTTIDAEGIEIVGGEDCVFAKCFETMPNLRYFYAHLVNFQGTSRYFPTDLKWLQLTGCHFDSSPSDFNFEKVVVLKLSNTNMAQVLMNQLPLSGKVFERLKVLSISDAKIKIIPSFKTFPSLVKLEINYCQMLATIDESIGKLENMTYLGISNCEILIKLPDSISRLSSLEVLDICGCSMVSNLPERMGDLISLKKLDLSRTSIVKIPDSIGQLTNLHELLAVNCVRLSGLPDSFCQLSSLEILNLQYCVDLTSLPERLGDMRSLKKLELSDTIIPEIADSIGQLTNLRELLMAGCKRLSKLPDSICQLSSLEVLDLGCCTNLSYLPEQLGDMKSLKKLDLSWTFVEVLPNSICQLCLLELLDLAGCFGLCSLPKGLEDMDKLETLILNNTRIEVKLDLIRGIKKPLMDAGKDS